MSIMIFVAFFAFLVLFFLALWVWHQMRKHATLLKDKLKRWMPGNGK